MPPKTEPVEALASQEPSVRERLLQAFKERDEAAQALVPDPLALTEAEKKVQALVYQFNDSEEFDSYLQPVMHTLSLMARSRNPLAVRLLLQERFEIELHQNPKSEPQKPSEEIGINGVICTIPRGLPILLPKSYYDILRQSEVR